MTEHSFHNVLAAFSFGVLLLMLICGFLLGSMSATRDIEIQLQDRAVEVDYAWYHSKTKELKWLDSCNQYIVTGEGKCPNDTILEKVE